MRSWIIAFMQMWRLGVIRVARWSISLLHIKTETPPLKWALFYLRIQLEVDKIGFGASLSQMLTFKRAYSIKKWLTCQLLNSVADPSFMH